MGAGESVSAEVARCVEVIEASGLPFELHAMGTIVEGELDEVLGVMRRCIEKVAENHPRVTCAAKVDYRHGAAGRMRGKVESVERRLGRRADPQ
ncbi:hypothetical protein Mal64_19460 [Pseudobythopirellula maris]|uniref:Thiamine-binding protein domain-containing protein n=2 Tax=Pseudobythopirellula maris TaxID=2527991 RepID=A0A5C5ZLY2_9BACT|nr:hypothetical protein Mal64_19460 [Pseudobythopirellula maris]